MHWWSSGHDWGPRNAASVFLAGAQGSTPSRCSATSLLFDNSARSFCTHDVAAACCLARAEARVRFPLGALSETGCRKAWNWRRRREPEIVRSNRTALARLRWGLCWYRQAAVNRPFAGSIPATAAHVEGQANWRWQPPRKRSSDRRLGGSTRAPTRQRWSPSALCPWPSGRGTSLPSWRDQPAVGARFDSRRALRR